MKTIEPKSTYFIKLGSGGQWEKPCIENGTIRLGFKETDHGACLAGNWGKIRDDELKNGRAKGKATEITNEIQHFYEEGEETLWITFYANRMWWCFTKRAVEQLQDGSKIRNVIGQWRDTDIHGRLKSEDFEEPFAQLTAPMSQTRSMGSRHQKSRDQKTVSRPCAYP
jgi:hypothetical protein